MMQAQIALDTVVKAAPEHLVSEIDGEAVILNVESGTYYGLNQVGARIWQLIQQPSQVKAVSNQLIAEYEVEPQICHQDLIKILTQMCINRLVTVCSYEQAK